MPKIIQKEVPVGRLINRGKWSESVIKLFDFAHSTDVH